MILFSVDSTYHADTYRWDLLRARVKPMPVYPSDVGGGFRAWLLIEIVNPYPSKDIPILPLPVLLQRSLFSFAHRSITFTIPFDNPTATKITSRIDVLDQHIFLWSVRNYVLTHPAHSINTDNILTNVAQLLNLQLTITRLSSKYSTPVKISTKEPNLVLTFQDRTKVSSSQSIDLQGLTIMCSRSDGIKFESISFNISLEFEETITSLSTHVFSISATTLSATGIYSEFTKTFFDSMTVSISVGPGE